MIAAPHGLKGLGDFQMTSLLSFMAAWKKEENTKKTHKKK
jgi:hypothetical protein